MRMQIVTLRLDTSSTPATHCTSVSVIVTQPLDDDELELDELLLDDELELDELLLDDDDELELDELLLDSGKQASPRSARTKKRPESWS